MFVLSSHSANSYIEYIADDGGNASVFETHGR